MHEEYQTKEIASCFFTGQTGYIEESILVGHPGYIFAGIAVEMKLDVRENIIYKALDTGILVTQPNNISGIPDRR